MNLRIYLFIVIAIVVAFCAYKKTLPRGVVAKKGESTIYNSYENISGMKHDCFKLFHQTFFTLLLLSPSTPIFSSNLFESVIGKSLLAGITMMTYHSLWQPYVNQLPAW